MSLIELLPNVLSLSRSDKLRLIQKLAEDLVRIEDPSTKAIDGVTVEIDEDVDIDEYDVEIREDKRVRQAAHVVCQRNTVGQAEDQAILNAPGTADLAEFDQELLSMFGGGRPIPIRFPDESYEAAAALMKLLEAEKSAK